MVFEETIPYIPYIRQLIFNWCSNHNDVDDIEQEILIKLYNKINTFQNKSKFSSWVYRLAYNTLCSFYNKRVSRAMCYNFDFDILQSHYYNRMEHIEERKALKNILLFIRKQPKTDQRIFYNIFLKDLSYKETAEKLKVNIRYVGVRINRIRNKIKTQFTFQMER